VTSRAPKRDEARILKLQKQTSEKPALVGCPSWTRSELPYLIFRKSQIYDGPLFFGADLAGSLHCTANFKNQFVIPNHYLRLTRLSPHLRTLAHDVIDLYRRS